MDGDTDKSLKNEIEILQTLLECKYLTMLFGFVIDFSVPSIFFYPVSAAWQEWWTGSTGKPRRRTCFTCFWKGFSIFHKDDSVDDIYIMMSVCPCVCNEK